MQIIAVVIIKAIASWFVLAFIGKNLIGFIVRNLFTDPVMEKVAHDYPDFFKQEATKFYRAGFMISFVSAILVVVFFYLLLHFLHPGFAVAVAMLMVGGIPDLVWEIRHGQKFDRKNPPKGVIYFISGLLLWGALPVLFWAFYSA